MSWPIQQLLGSKYSKFIYKSQMQCCVYWQSVCEPLKYFDCNFSLYSEWSGITVLLFDGCKHPLSFI
jgi:hypothetical protein